MYYTVPSSYVLFNGSLTFFLASCSILTVSFLSRARSDKEHFHGEERGDGSLATDRVRRPRSMTTGVCSKTVARGRKIRANPPHSTPVYLPLSVPFARGRNESKWRHRTLTMLTHFPLRAGALVAESHDVRGCARIRDVQSGRVFARTRHFYDDPSSPLYHDWRTSVPSDNFFL